jgi:hypothetical protein
MACQPYTAAANGKSGKEAETPKDGRAIIMDLTSKNNQNLQKQDGTLYG